MKRQIQKQQQQQQATTFSWILGVKMLDAVLDACTPAICTANESDWLSRTEVLGSDAVDGSGFVRGGSIEAAERKTHFWLIFMSVSN